MNVIEKIMALGIGLVGVGGLFSFITIISGYIDLFGYGILTMVIGILIYLSAYLLLWR